jgi:hypothetical protein
MREASARPSLTTVGAAFAIATVVAFVAGFIFMHAPLAGALSMTAVVDHESRSLAPRRPPSWPRHSHRAGQRARAAWSSFGQVAAAKKGKEPRSRDASKSHE